MDDPKLIGYGIWTLIHIFSLRLGKEEFINFMYNISIFFPCVKCKKHCIEYMKINPIEEYKNKIFKRSDNNEFLEIGLFVWTWKFHNAVNKRLNKEEKKLIDMYNLYSNKNNVCGINCFNSK